MSKPPTSTSKDVIYIDVEDEITAIIEKVSASPHKIVALVLPKRATTLQSIVNMKLLQKTAVSSKKNIVLITQDSNLLPLAGAVGMHVAKTPQSKPYIPAVSASTSDDQDEVSAKELEDADFDKAEKGAIAVGALAGTSKDTDETIELDNENTDSEAKPTEKKSKQKDAKSGPNVPNFNRFRKWLFIGITAGVLLIGGMVYAFVTMPYANIAIATDIDEISTTLDVTFDAAATAVSADPATVPSVVEKVDKTNSETVPATGERNDGVKATGEVTMSICTASPFDVKTVPAGTGVSTGGKNYITQAKATFAYTYEACEGSKFKFESAAVDIVAQNAGASYNVQNAAFTVAASTATAKGSASGGTDDIKKIVTQADIDSATQKLEGKVDDTTKAELEKRLKDKGLIAIEESYTTSSATVTSNVPAGTEADQVTVIRKTTNTMVGAKQSDLDNLITQVVEKEIDTKKQSVLDTGVNNAVYELQNQQDNASKVLMSMDVKSTVGPDLNDDEIKETVKGMKAVEAEALIGSYPGVSSVEVTYGPFWVSAIPSDTEKITIVYEK